MDWNDSIAIATDALSKGHGKSQAWLINDQRSLARRLRLEPLLIGQVGTIAGVDVHYTNGKANAAVVILDRKTLAPSKVFTAPSEQGADYEHGFLAYRELPSILKVLAELEGPPDVIFYDGNGTLHPRGFGAACHLGVLLDIPTIGVSKNVSAYRPFTEKSRGETRGLEEERGSLLVTRDNTKPVCVSPGHRTNLSSSIELVLAASKSRIPEPIRLADRAARSGPAGNLGKCS